MAVPTTSTPLKIVRLDGIHALPPTFAIPHTYTEYLTTRDASTIASRIGDADVVITTTVPIRRATLEACPSLKFVAVMAIGFDIVDVEACKERGVKVANVPAANSESCVVCFSYVCEGRGSEWLFDACPGRRVLYSLLLGFLFLTLSLWATGLEFGMGDADD